MAWHFSDTATAEKVIEDIENGKISNSATAYGILNQIINDLSGTYVAEKAKRLRDSL